MAPGAASQVIGHKVTRHILGVEIHIAVGDGIGEAHLAGTVFIGIPAVKGIGNAIRFLRCGKVTDEVRDIRGIILVVVRSPFPLIAVGASIPQIVGSGIDILCLNFNGAVHMVLFVIGNFVGMQDDCFYIVRRVDCRYSATERFVDCHPVASVICIFRESIAAAGRAARPGDNTASRIEAVFIIHPGSACNIDLAFSQRFPPLIHAIGSRIAGRCLQVVEIGRFVRVGRFSFGNSNRMGGSLNRAVPICDRDGNGSFTGLDAVNLTVLVHSEDFIVAALPDRGKNGCVLGGQFSSQLSLGKGLDSGFTSDADFGKRDRSSDGDQNGVTANICLRICNGYICFTNSYAGDHTVLYSEDIRIAGRPFQAHIRVLRIHRHRERNSAARQHGVVAGDGYALQLGLCLNNFDSDGFFLLSIMFIRNHVSRCTICMGYGHRTGFIAFNHTIVIHAGSTLF